MLVLGHTFDERQQKIGDENDNDATPKAAQQTRGGKRGTLGAVDGALEVRAESDEGRMDANVTVRRANQQLTGLQRVGNDILDEVDDKLQMVLTVGEEHSEENSLATHLD